MTDHVGLRRILAWVLNGSLICALGTGYAADRGNRVNPSQWMGGNSWASPGYGYDGRLGPGGPATYRSQPGRASA